MDPQQTGEQALRQADRAARRGDLAAAERWTKVAAQAAAQAERLANAARASACEDYDEEAVREELRRRIEAFVSFDRDAADWEAEHEAYKKAVEHSRRTGAPLSPPMRPHPAGPRRDIEAQAIHILQGPLPEDGKR